MTSTGSTAPYGIELFSDAWQHLDPFTVTSQAFRAARGVVQAARSTHDTTADRTS